MRKWSKDTYVLNGWPQTNIVKYFLCIVTAKYAKTSLPARKISFFSSITITIILSYAIIRIYIILHIYFQVPLTEEPTELHSVIGQSVLEKINSINFTEYNLPFQECYSKNANVLLRIRMFLTSRLHK